MITPPKASLADSAGTTVVPDALDAELARVLEAYVAAVEGGRAVDPDRLLAEHPAIADRLRGCLASLRFLGDATISLGGAPALDPQGPAVAALGPTLGDYRIIRELGRGGMGIVYEAEQVSLGRRVAIKVLPFAAVLDQKQIQRFKNEAHAAAQLHHTSIVPVFAVGCERGVHFYAMQYIEGQSLSQVIKDLRAIAGLPGEPAGDLLGSVSELSKGLAAGWFEPARKAPATDPRAASRDGSGTAALSAGTPGASTRSRAFFRSAASLGLQAAEALEHAHSLGIVHRDVKPGNFLLDVRGDLWVTDFGLARCQSDASLTMSGDLLGTLRYMSPEQALAKRVTVDHRTDVYSLGATLYELLTLEPVFDGRDRQELLRKIAFEEPRSPRRLNRSIPLDLETIVLKAVTKDPDGRYASAREVADDLKSFLDDRPIQARRLTLLQKAARWSRRRKVGVSAAAAILVLLGATGILGYRSHREAQWSAYRDKVERAAAQIGLAQTSINSLTAESSRMLELGFYSLRKLRMRGLDAMLAPLREAAGDLEDAREILPGRPEAPYYRARALLLLEKKEEALKELERAADRDFAPALALLAAIDELGEADHPVNGRKDKARVEKVLSSDWARTLLAIHRAVARRDWRAAAEGYGKLIDLEERGAELYLASGIDSRLGRGVALLEARDDLGALMDFAGAKARWPASLVPDLLVGHALLRLGEEEKAEKVFLGAYDRAAFKDEVAYAVMRYYSSNDMATRGRGRGPLEKALAWADRLDREDIKALSKADLYAWMGEGQKTIDAVTRAIDLNPADAASRALRGMILRFTGNFEDAEREVLEAVRLDPDAAEPCWLLGWFYADRGMNLEAAAAGREGHRRNPGDLFQFVLVARWLAYAGELEEAKGVLDGILRDNRTSTYALEHLGQVLTLQGKYADAIAVFEEALKINPECTATNNSMSFTFRRMGKLEEAERYARKAIEAGYFNTGAVFQLAEALLVQKKYAQTIQLSRNTIREFEFFAALHDYLARALEAQGDFQGALEAYARAVELQQDRMDLSVHDRAAALLEKRPELAAAAPNLAGTIEKVLEEKAFHPGIPRVVKALAPKLDEPARKALEAKLLDRARREVEKSGRRDPGLLALLAEVELGNGSPAEAVLTLEEARRLPDAPRSLEARLVSYRQGLLPDIASFASIDALLPSLTREAVIPDGAPWRLFRGTSEPPGKPGTWMETDHDDSSWEQDLPSGFGYGDGDDRTILDGMQGNYTTVYIRTSFSAPDPSRHGALVLSVRADDGFVAFLNGKEIGRRRAGPAGSFLPFDATAETWAEEPLAAEEIVLPRELLRGQNCLALQGLNHGNASSDFSLIPVLEAEVPLDAERRARILERFQGGAAREGAAARIAYLEGKLLEMAGEHAGALSAFRKAAALESGAPEPVLQAAACLRASGDAPGAAETLRSALSATLGESRALFEEWALLSFRELKSTPGEMLANFPTGPGGADLRWLLERLAAGDVVRIDCGSGEDHSHENNLWGKDRFFLGGKAALPVEEEIRGTSPASLHRTQRVFPPDGVHPAAYRVPLAAGSYRVTLHFAETFYRVARRKFDVRLEGTVVIDGHEPLAKGFAVAHQEARTVTVTDGALDIELAGRQKAPAVSAIEIERVE